jgi:Bacterial aa3 type cytochrome c oxidase subunit IV
MAENVNSDYEQHVRDYRSFVRGAQIVIAVLAITLILMAFFLL